MQAYQPRCLKVLGKSSEEILRNLLGMPCVSAVRARRGAPIEAPCAAPLRRASLTVSASVRGADMREAENRGPENKHFTINWVRLTTHRQRVRAHATNTGRKEQMFVSRCGNGLDQFSAWQSSAALSTRWPQLVYLAQERLWDSVACTSGSSASRELAGPTVTGNGCLLALSFCLVEANLNQVLEIRLRQWSRSLSSRVNPGYLLFPLQTPVHG